MVSVLFIDDSSTDGTMEAIRLAAYILGFRWALSQGHERLIQMDARSISSHDSALPYDTATAKCWGHYGVSGYLGSVKNDDT